MGKADDVGTSPDTRPSYGGEYLDFDAATYTSLDTSAPSLADAWRESFLNSFFAVSELSQHHWQEARQMLGLQEGLHPDGTRIIRVEFPFMGRTDFYEWDGSEAEALELAFEVGQLMGYDVGSDQAHGPTGWEADFDPKS